MGAEQAIEQRLRAILEQSSDGIMLLDREGRIISVTHPILGKRTEGAEGAQSLDQVHPDDRAAARQLLADSLNAPGEIRRAMLRSWRADGTPCWLETVCRNLIDNPAVGALVLNYRDVTASLAHEQRIQELLKQEQQLLKQEQSARLEAEQAGRDHREMEHKLGLLVEASGVLVGSLVTDDVVNSILAIARQLIQADAYAVWRGDPDGGQWKVVAAEGLSDRYIEESLLITESGRRALSQAIVVEDANASGLLPARKDQYEQEGIRSFLAAPLRIHGVPSGTITLYFRQPHRFTASEISLATGLANVAASVLGTSELYQRQRRMRAEAEAAERRSRFIARAIAALSSSLDYATTLANVARLAVPHFADWCAVDICTGGGIERLAIEHVDPEKIALAHEMRRRYPPDSNEDRGVARVLRTGEAQLMADITDEMLAASAVDETQLRALRELGLRSAMIVPMLARGKTLGAITFVSSHADRAYSEDDLVTATQLANHAALAIDNSRLFAAAEAEKAEAQAAAEALRQSNLDLEQFAYIASHDLQEPLRTVSSFSELLHRRYGGQLGEDAGEMIDYIVTSARRMSALIQDTLLYSRQGRDSSDQNASADASAALQTALWNMQSSITESGARIEAGQLPRVRMHANQLSLVFQNLVGNAVKYRRKEVAPCIQVAAERSGPEWILSVHDNGIGFRPEYATRIFGIFKRLHATGEYPGTGIGLAIVQRIVERYGGRVWAEAEEGCGAKFSFTVRPVARGG